MTTPAPFHLLVDTREQRPPPWPDGVTTERITLKTGDYTTRRLEKVGVIERKSASDFASTITWGRERWDREVERLHEFRWKLVVVEAEFQDVIRSTHTHPYAVIGTLASLIARHDLPVTFVSNPFSAGRLICGVLRRWEERVAAEEGAAA